MTSSGTRDAVIGTSFLSLIGLVGVLVVSFPDTRKRPRQKQEATDQAFGYGFLVTQDEATIFDPSNRLKIREMLYQYPQASTDVRDRYEFY